MFFKDAVAADFFGEGPEMSHCFDMIANGGMAVNWTLVEVKAAVPSRDDDAAAGEKSGAKIFESGSDDDRRIGDDLQGTAAVLEQYAGEVSAEAAGAIQDGCRAVSGGSGERAEGDVDGALVHAD